MVLVIDKTTDQNILACLRENCVASKSTCSLDMWVGLRGGGDDFGLEGQGGKGGFEMGGCGRDLGVAVGDFVGVAMPKRFLQQEKGRFFLPLHCGRYPPKSEFCPPY
jgi:hypothetical protein